MLIITFFKVQVSGVWFPIMTFKAILVLASKECRVFTTAAEFALLLKNLGHLQCIPVFTGAEKAV